MQRRSFLKSVMATSALATIPGLPTFARILHAPDAGMGWIAAPVNRNNNILVVIRLFGGNDGLNTLVPIHDDEYYRIRRDTASVDMSIRAESTIGLAGSTDLAFHPSMKPLAELFDEKKLAIVQGVGYPNMDLSHFRGTNIWLSASDSDVFETTGWMGRFLELRHERDMPSATDPFAIEMGDKMGRAFVGTHSQMGITYSVNTPIAHRVGLSVDESSSSDLHDLIHRQALDGKKFITRTDDAVSSVPYGNGRYYEGPGNFGTSLRTISRSIRGGLSTQLYIVHTGQFDTHSNQQYDHAQQLDEMSTNVLAFQREMEEAGLDHRVSVLIISEFGRRPSPKSTGTDHGTAAPVFVVGSAVNGGLLGVTPSVHDLNIDGNLHWHVDFRSIYASVLEQWFGDDPSTYLPSILPRQFPTLPLFRTSPPVSDSQPSVWPTPCSTVVNIGVTPGTSGMIRATVTDVNGRPLRVYDAEVSNDAIQLNVSSISQGMYVVQLASGAMRSAIPIIIRR